MDSQTMQKKSVMTNDMTVAVEKEDIDMVKHLIRKCREDKVDINDRYYNSKVVSRDTSSPLECAAMNHDREITQLLIDAGMDPHKDSVENVRDCFGDKEALNILLSCYKKKEDRLEPFLEYMKTNDLCQLEENLMNGYNPNQNIPSTCDNNAMGTAISWGDYDAVELFLKYGANPNHNDEKSMLHLLSAVSYAISYHDQENYQRIFDILIHHKANVNQVCKLFGCTSLHEAVKLGSVEYVKKLLHKGADPKLKNKNGETSMDIAIKSGFTEIVNILRGHMGIQTRNQAKRLAYREQQMVNDMEPKSKKTRGKVSTK